MADHAELLRVLGWPCPHDPLPIARSAAWAAARLAIQDEFLLATGVRGRIRSPTALWGALRGEYLPLGLRGVPLLMEWGCRNWCKHCKRPLPGRDYDLLHGMSGGWCLGANRAPLSGSAFGDG